MGVKNFFEASCAESSSDGHCFGTAAGLALWADGSMEIAAGAAATLAVRPEALRLSIAPPQPTPQNLVEGVVVEAIYEGDSRRWSVELDGGIRVVARASNAAGDNEAALPARGARVWLTWDPARGSTSILSGLICLPPRP